MWKKQFRTAPIVTLLCIVCFSVSNSGYAQGSHKAYYTGPLEFSYPKMSYFPPLSMGMPFDVLIGYVYLDSIFRTVPISVMDSAIGDYRVPNSGAIGYSDTLRKLAKYLYEIDDYDPIRFSQYTHLNAPGTRYPSGGPLYVSKNIFGAITSKFPDTMRTALLCMSDYIAHVKVTGLLNMLDPDSLIPARSAVKVTCNVLDLIKGQVIPGCIPDTLYSSRKAKSATLFGSPSCLQFEYRLDWPRINHGDLTTNEDSTYVINGHPWIQADSEYIVYLSIQSLGYDSISSYCTIKPRITTESKMGSMYPVVGGIVLDPYDEMGFGMGLTADDYKSKLRARIYSLLHP